MSSTLSCISSLASKHNYILIGDFNFPDVDWHSLCCTHPNSRLFCDFVFNNNFTQLVCTPTHSKGNILDLVLINSDDLVSELAVLSKEPFPGLKSDHHLLSFKMSLDSLPMSKRPLSYSFNFSKGNYLLMNEYIFSLDLSIFYTSYDIEYLWSTFKSLLHDCYHRFIPKLRDRRTHYPKWFNSNLVHQSHHVNFLRKKSQKSPTVHNVLELQKAETSLANQIATDKRQFEERLVTNNAFRNSSSIFSYIRSLRKQPGFPSAMFSEDDSAFTSHGKAELFNKFFQSVFTPMSTSQKSPPTESVGSISFDVDDVFRYLSLLDPNKSMGIDQIPNYVLKSCSKSLCLPVYHLFIQCVIQSYLPHEWRIHKIISIHKSSDKSEVKNYRPISLLCCISKVLESIVYDCIYDEISNHISANQFGFLRQRSTLQQLMKFMINVHEAFNNKSQLDTVYFDIRKAFDSVSHGLLLDKLVDAGVSSTSVWKFVKAYLVSRQQCVSVDNTISSFLPVTSGVPQGSILGTVHILRQ